jgi:HSP20 family protein
MENTQRNAHHTEHGQHGYNNANQSWLRANQGRHSVPSLNDFAQTSTHSTPSQQQASMHAAYLAAEAQQHAHTPYYSAKACCPYHLAQAYSPSYASEAWNPALTYAYPAYSPYSAATTERAASLLAQQQYGFQGQLPLNGYSPFTGFQGQLPLNGYSPFTGFQGQLPLNGYSPFTGFQGQLPLNGYSPFTGFQGQLPASNWTSFSSTQGQLPASHFAPQQFGFQNQTGSWSPAVNVIETNDAYLVNAEVCGVREEDVEIYVQHNILTIRGQKQLSATEQQHPVQSAERVYGPFTRTVVLATPVQAAKVKAQLQFGVLEIECPKISQQENGIQRIKIAKK